MSRAASSRGNDPSGPVTSSEKRSVVSIDGPRYRRRAVPGPLPATPAASGRGDEAAASIFGEQPPAAGHRRGGGQGEHAGDEPGHGVGGLVHDEAEDQGSEDGPDEHAGLGDPG